VLFGQAVCISLIPQGQLALLCYSLRFVTIFDRFRPHGPYVSLKTRRFTCGLPERGGAFLLRMIDGVMNVLAERIFDQKPKEGRQ